MLRPTLYDLWSGRQRPPRSPPSIECSRLGNLPAAVGQPLLGPAALGVRTLRAAQHDLLARRSSPAFTVIRHMTTDEVRQRPHKDGRVVQAFRALEGNAELVRLLGDLNVELVQRLDVVGRERDGHQTDVFLAEFGEAGD